MVFSLFCLDPPWNPSTGSGPCWPSKTRSPRYVPLYMVYPDSAALFGIGNALTRAYLPGLSPGERLQLLRRILKRRLGAAGHSGCGPE